MELNDLKMLAAASLLSGHVMTGSSDGGRTHFTVEPSPQDIAVAVSTAQRIWEEVLEQGRANRKRPGG